MGTQFEEYIDEMSQIMKRIILNDKYNFIKKDGTYLSEKWFDKVWYFRDGFRIVKLNNKWNYIDKEGNVIFCSDNFNNNQLENLDYVESHQNFL